MTNRSTAEFRCARLAAAALALGIFSSAGLAPVSAQDASPVASPDAVVCVSTGLPPGTPTPMDEMGEMDMGTPVGETADTGSPVAAEDMGSPAAAVEETEEDVTGTPADEATTAVVVASVTNYAACYNEGQASGDPGLYVALESTAFIASQGYANPYDRVADEIGSPFRNATLLDIDNVMIWGDGRVSADVQILLGDHWYNSWRVFMTERGGIWAWDEQTDLPPTPNVDFVAVNGINITETTDEATGEITYAFVSVSGSWDFVATEAIVFNITNSGAELHEAILMQLPEGADPLGLLDGSIAFEDVTLFGAVSDIDRVARRSDHAESRAGTYTLVCFYPSSGRCAARRPRDGPAVQHRRAGRVVGYTSVAGAGHSAPAHVCQIFR